MKMELNSIVLIFLLFSTISCYPHEDSEEEDDSGDKGRLREVMNRIRLEQRQFVEEKFAELTDLVETVNGAKLDHITEVVESVRRTQKYFQMCTKGVCGEHGTCDLSADAESIECHCEEEYVGEHCEITGPCNVTHYDIQQQSPRMLGVEDPHCVKDGSFAGMQFMGSQAFCVTRDNVEISGYSVNRWEIGDDMNCQCARDEHEHELSGTLDARVFNCMPNGNYPQVACNSEMCWCQDWQGQPYGEPVPVGELDIQLEC